MKNQNDFKCDDCHKEVETLYQGWFRNVQSMNPWAKGTASAGVMQQKRLCYDCMKKTKLGETDERSN